MLSGKFPSESSRVPVINVYFKTLGKVSQFNLALSAPLLDHIRDAPFGEHFPDDLEFAIRHRHP